MDAFGVTDRGLGRETNQDSIAIDNSIMLYMVADGMGGHAMGEVASKKAVATVTSVVHENITSYDNESLTQDEPVLSIMKKAVTAANREIFEYSRGETMGTTLSTAHFSNGKLYIAHIGDSRIYRLRRDLLEALTEDHTEARALVKAGRLSPEKAENHYLSHILTKALGSSRTASPDLSSFRVKDGDIYLLSSDGLFRVVSPEEIKEVLAKDMSPEEKCNMLLNVALGRGAPDNVSVIIIEAPGPFEKIISGVKKRFMLHKGWSL
jgi:PPM family protein phosphatase